jgi:hypothetical protein
VVLELANRVLEPEAFVAFEAPAAADVDVFFARRAIFVEIDVLEAFR